MDKPHRMRTFHICEQLASQVFRGRIFDNVYAQPYGQSDHIATDMKEIDSYLRTFSHSHKPTQRSFKWNSTDYTEGQSYIIHNITSRHVIRYPLCLIYIHAFFHTF